jgi:hypothetical protein
LIDNALGRNLVPSDFLDNSGRHATYDGMRRHVIRNYGPGSHHSAFAHTNTIGDYGAGAQPDVVFNDDPLGGDALISERPVRIIKNMVYGNDLGNGRGLNPVTDLHPTLAADDSVLADQAVPADPDPRVGHVAKVVDMENRPMHDDGLFTNFDAPGTSVQIAFLVQIDSVAQFDMVGKAQSHPILYGCQAIHFQNQPVRDAPKRYSNQGWNPANQQEKRLLQEVAPKTRRLPA